MRDEDVRTCLRVLAELADAPHDDPDLASVRQAVSVFVKKTRGRQKAGERRRRSEADAAVLAGTATGATDRQEGAPAVSRPVEDAPAPASGVESAPVPQGRAPVPPARRPVAPRRTDEAHLRTEDGPRRIGGLLACYACKAHFRQIDGFYHRLCPPCAEENRSHRSARTDLSGRRAIVTGGRVKAGFELVLKLLRDGAAVTALTRFPSDARRRFAAVDDHAEWRDRLTVTGIDLRDLPAVVRWCDEQVAAAEPLDILVNLAAQTLRHPPESYAALIAAERAAGALPARAGALSARAGALSARAGSGPESPDHALPVAGPAGFAERLVRPAGEGSQVTPTVGPDEGSLSAVPGIVDVAGLLPDPSPVNSWTRLVHEVDPVELLEVQLINVTAPFVLLGRLRPLLTRSPWPRRYVVNVSAVEGQFDRMYKGPEHPHTNMAKAALNMLTRTTADELAGHGVYVTSVDPGWFTDQQPEPDRHRRTAAGFRPPLDVVDAAARLYDPIVRGERGDPLYGCFLKDYRVTPW
ncbi:SDR family NAD(P)-dependent oxidoreductase [Actinomadura sp. HBU206391]|uniref:SDR family NAD(P)-dependent oxidoreductase n=1 Tax=Actinomadura sp. HBU206391 TaxID=2731692 RepID=UPI001650CFA7|nr:SDR family NAD(P)-dependent oxidoreductase [Actinomadura sp. HBU206391]MBC6457307.1 SDR family NAD(P)-dependent oxidoreductase [Actinomadura sp. HBU206391]